MKILGLIAGAVMLLGAQGAYAATIYSTSFENPANNTAAPGYPGFVTLGSGSTIDGWTVGGAGVDLINGYWTSQDGAQSLDMNSSGPGSITQTFSGLIQGMTYKMTFWITPNSNAGTPDFKTLKVSATNANKSTNYGFFVDDPADNSSLGRWALQTFYFTVGASGTETLTFAGTSGGPAGMALDNINIAATPIPGALLLFGSALGGMGFLGYRRKKQAAEA
jgi:choice-of-anchor C domain-containing protein